MSAAVKGWIVERKPFQNPALVEAAVNEIGRKKVTVEKLRIFTNLAVAGNLEEAKKAWKNMGLSGKKLEEYMTKAYECKDRTEIAVSKWKRYHSDQDDVPLMQYLLDHRE